MIINNVQMNLIFWWRNYRIYKNNFLYLLQQFTSSLEISKKLLGIHWFDAVQFWWNAIEKWSKIRACKKDQKQTDDEEELQGITYLDEINWKAYPYLPKWMSHSSRYCNFLFKQAIFINRLRDGKIVGMEKLNSGLIIQMYSRI